MSVLEKAIGLLAPPQCVSCGEEGAALCTGCSGSLAIFGQRCWRCNRLSPGSKTCASCRHVGGPSRVFIRTDHDGLARDLLSVYKFGHQRAAATTIANLMAAAFFENAPKPDDYLIVPIPTAASRMRQRGFDHAALLAKKLSFKLKMSGAQPLGRLGHARQLGAKREDRLTQLSASFYVKNPQVVVGRNILLIDDVVTTGGTLIAATQTLRRVGAARVDALLFAKRL